MNGEAKYLHDSELLNEIFDKMEANAFEWAVGVPFADDESRRIAIAEVRAIRSVRGKLKAMLLATNPAPGAVV